MKNFKLFVFSFIFALSFFSCKKETPLQNNYQVAHVEPRHMDFKVIDSSELLNFQYVQEVQLGVADTSHTSLSASIATASDVANKLDELAYKASQKMVILNAKIKKYDALISQVDSLTKIKSYQLAQLKSKHHERYYANLE